MENQNPQAAAQQNAEQAQVAPQQQVVEAQPQQALQATDQHPLHGLRFPPVLKPFAQALAEPIETFRACFPTKKEADMILRREVEFAMQAMQSNNFLITCASKDGGMSLTNSVKNIALTGLSLNPALKQAYLVPFKGVVTFMPSYIGMRDILIRTGLVTNIEAHIVYEDELDNFSIEFGENAHLRHKPNVFSRNHSKNTMMGAYYIATLPTGKQIFDTMNMDELLKVQQASPSYGKQSPWDTWYEEMVKKTLIRRGFKAVPHVNLTDESLKVIQATLAADDAFFIGDRKVKASDRNDFDEFEDVSNEPA